MGQKKSVPAVPKKVKDAIEILLDQPKRDLEAAASAVGITCYRLREALGKGHVRTYYWHRKRAVIEAISLGNPRALKDVRDTSENGMAVVAAAKAIEQMRMEAHEQVGGMHRPAPGLTIVIESPGGQSMKVVGPPSMPLIDARPAAAFEPEMEQS